MRNYFTFGDIDSRDFGVYISGTGTFDAPKRAYNSIAVPGRNGALLGSEHRLENIELTYPAFVYVDFSENMGRLRSALLSRIGYQKLSDSYHPDEYRMAVYKGGLSAEPIPGNHAGWFDLEFECKPQRWLQEGDRTSEISNGAFLLNPTSFEALPRIRAYGYGTVVVGSITVTIAQHSNPYIDIDCDMMDCFCGTTNCNSLVSFSGNDFPTLPAGKTGITYSGNITKVEITPRYWRV